MIILKKVKLRNFLSHENTELSFPLGITVIVGPNGAGKTAIMDAIIHALLGFERDVRMRGERVDDLIRRGTNKLDIELVFEANNREYIAHWTRVKGGYVDATLRRSDIGYIARSAKQVRREILKLLRLDSKTLLNSIFIRQGEITSLIDARPSERKKLIGKMIGLDTLEKVWEDMLELIKFVEDYKYKLEKDFISKQAELKNKKESHNKLRREIKELQDRVDRLRRELESVRREYAVISKEMNVLDEKESRFNELQKELGLTLKDIENVGKDVKKLRDEIEKCKEAKEELEKLKPEIAKIPFLEKYSEKLKELKDYNKEKEQLEKSIDILNKAKNTIKKSLERFIDIVEDSDITDIDLSSEPVTLNNKAIALSSKSENLAKQLKEKETELATLINKVRQVLPKPTKQAWHTEFSKVEERLSKLENIINEKTEKIGGIRSEIEKLNHHLRNLDKLEVCPLCRTRLTPEHKGRAKQEILREINSLSEEQKRIEKELKELKSQEEILKHRKERILKISGDIDRIEKLSREIVSVRKKLKETCYESRKVLKKIISVEREIQQKLQEIKEHLTRIHSELKELIENLGYKPSKPEEELTELRKKKEKYDQLKPIANQYDQKIRELKELEKKLDELKKKKEELLKTIEKLGYDREQHNEVKRKYEEIKDRLTRLESSLESAEEQLIKEKDELIEIKNSIEQLRNSLLKLQKKLERIEDFKFKLEKIREAFSKDGIQKMLRQRLAPYMSELATKYVERFNLDITSIIVDEDLDVAVIRGGETVPISLLSGGEKVAIAIALRLAIAKALAGRLSTIIMDEPTIHLDEERRRELVEVVKSFFKEGSIVPQMIIITHDRELEEVADTLYQIEKINGISRIREHAPIVP